MITETLKADVLTAVKSGDSARRNILKLVLGEVELSTARTGVALPDDKVFQIIRKIIEGNDQVIVELKKRFIPGLSLDDFKRDMLQNENSILSSYLPKMLTLEEIVLALPDELKTEIKSSTPNDYGKLTGKVMAYLKGKGLSANGNHVKMAILNVKG